MFSDKATTCPKCGTSVEQQAEEKKRQKNSVSSFVSSTGCWIRSIVILSILGFLVMIVISGFVVYYSVISTIIDDSDKKEELRELRHIEMYSSVDSVSKNINSTFWTFTEDLSTVDGVDYWYRLHFKDGKLYFYEVSPSEGNWGEPLVTNYEIEERRYSNNGEKYVCVTWNGSPGFSYTLVPLNGMLYWHSKVPIGMDPYGFVHGGYSYGNGEIGFMYEGDKNPWK